MTKLIPIPEINITNPGGQTYSGEFNEDGQSDGQGILRDPNGSTYYEGDFKEGKFDGKGVLRCSDGSTYEGDFKEGKFDGKGVARSPDGNLDYEGEYRDGHRHGEGKIFGDPVTYNEGFIARQKKDNPKKYIIIQGYDDEIRPKESDISANQTALIKNPKDLQGLEIENFVCQRKSGEPQICVYIAAHGSIDGKLSKEDSSAIIESLKTIHTMILAYNAQNEGDPIKRIKINLTSCYGEKVINESLLEVISRFARSGIEVRTSSADKDHSSVTLYNGKNAIPFRINDSEKIKIVEGLFSQDQGSAKKFGSDKQDRYQELTLSKVSSDGKISRIDVDQNLWQKIRAEADFSFKGLRDPLYFFSTIFGSRKPPIFYASGIKVYQTVNAFLGDKYDDSETKNPTASMDKADISNTATKINPIYESDDEDGVSTPEASTSKSQLPNPSPTDTSSASAVTGKEGTILE